MKQWIQRHLPARQTLMEQRWLRPFHPALSRPGVWHLNRHSAALGVAVGLVAGLLPGPAQIISAALLSIVLRANLPVAAFTTLYTNPLTIVPLYLLAYHIGSLVMGTSAIAAPAPALDLRDLTAYVTNVGNWIYGLGDTLVIGLIVQAALFACLGYLTVRTLWLWTVLRRWRGRHIRAPR